MKVSDTTISETDAIPGTGETANGNNQIVTVRKGIRNITIDCVQVRERIEAGEQVADIAAELGIRAKQLRHVLEMTGGKPREQPSEATAELQAQAATKAAIARQVKLLTPGPEVAGMARLDAIGIDAIIDLIAEQGTTRNLIAEQTGVSNGLVSMWIEARGYADRVARARQHYADRLAQETLALADDESIDTNRAKLMIDARRWLASKWNRSVYGDKVDVTNTVTVQRLTDEQLAEKALQIQQRLGMIDGAA